MTFRARLWLTPTTVVIAVAFAAAVTVMSFQGVGIIRGWLAAPAAVSPQPTYTVPGSIRLHAGQYAAQGQTCQGTTIKPDAQVVVSDSTGATLTYAPVRAGALVDGACELPFTLVMPAGKGSYGIDFPQYGLMPYTEQQIADLLELIIG